MKRVYRLDNLDCANCAEKIEKAIAKIDGVTNASINFMSSKLTLEANDNIFETVLKEASKVAKKIENVTIRQ